MFALGIDVGTSGVRTAVVHDSGRIVGQFSVPMPTPEIVDGRPVQDPEIWWKAVWECVCRQISALRNSEIDPFQIAGIAVDGTSGTMLLADNSLIPVTPGFMYNSGRFEEQAGRILEVAPPDSHACGSGSGLARAMYLLSLPNSGSARFIMHQADWIAGRLAGVGGFSDQNNVLKTGYDLARQAWPEWLDQLGPLRSLLPVVYPPGAIVARIDDRIAERTGLPPDCRIHAGTTDSTAAFLATGARDLGDAVTSLGTTMVIKSICDREIRQLDRGIYSHRIGNLWLAGGASNTGGGALLKHFTTDQINAMTARLQPGKLVDMGYYPLPAPGERFPVNDPHLESRDTPRPVEDDVFFQGLLTGIANVERQAYRALAELGAKFPKRVLTVGGGAANSAWCAIREQILGVPVLACGDAPAAAGAARLVFLKNDKSDD